jgi:glycosyltransferase involved in cell wall biosynthesis
MRKGAPLNIVVAVRCYNEEQNIPRFMKGYDFADCIVVSDGNSTDNSVEMLKEFPKVHLIHFKEQETVNGQTWNLDAPHMNFVLDEAKRMNPTWLLFDDMDDVPCLTLRENARIIFDQAIRLDCTQVNAFRLYLWGDTGEYFPYMNRNFNDSYRSLWGWRPDRLNIRADESIRHGTLTGLAEDKDIMNLNPPHCLLHKSWHPDTVQKKVDRYNALGIPNDHPLDFAGKPDPLPSWAVE